MSLRSGQKVAKVSINCPLQDGQRDTSFDIQGTIQTFIAVFGDSKIGAALFDYNRRLLAVNRTLAEMNRGSVEAHTGKKLGEIVNEKCCKAGSIVSLIFETGLPVHTEITAKLATRPDKATWSVSFIPIRDSAGRVALVSALVVETTKEKILAEVLHSLLTSLPQVRDKVSSAYVLSQSRKQSVDPALLARAAELSEQCFEALQQFADRLQTPEDSLPRSSGRSNQAALPFVGMAPPTEELVKSELTEREIEVVRLITAGKSSKEVAAILPITVKTVETYRDRIMSKLGYHSISDLVRFAVRTKLIDP